MITVTDEPKSKKIHSMAGQEIANGEAFTADIPGYDVLNCLFVKASDRFYRLSGDDCPKPFTSSWRHETIFENYEPVDLEISVKHK